MNPFDENPPVPPEPGDTPQPEAAIVPARSVSIQELPGDPMSYAATAPTVATCEAKYPADLQITWSWAHFIIFLFFGFMSLILVQGVLAVH